MDFISICCGPIKLLHASFLPFNAQNRIAAGLTSSRLAMEAYLIDKIADQGIQVVPVTRARALLIYTESHAISMPNIYREEAGKAAPTLRREEAASSGAEYAFIVEVPTASIGRSNEIKAIVDSLKAVGANYAITEI